MFVMFTSITQRRSLFTWDIREVIFRRIARAELWFTGQDGDTVHGEADVTIRVHVPGDSECHTIPGTAGR
jgi:hypothetical protein